MNPSLKVLIVEDDADVAMACEQTMRLEGLDCVCVSSAEQAQKHLSPDFAGIVVSDIRLPQMSGLGLLAAVRVLDAERYPRVSIAARRTGDNEVFEADITLHGVTRTVQLPVRVEQAADGRGLQASGSLLLKQSEFGIVPFAILGGAMAVQDQMELAFRITARQDVSAPGSGANPGR